MDSTVDFTATLSSRSDILPVKTVPCSPFPSTSDVSKQSKNYFNRQGVSGADFVQAKKHK